MHDQRERIQRENERLEREAHRSKRAGILSLLVVFVLCIVLARRYGQNNAAGASKTETAATVQGTAETGNTWDIREQTAAEETEEAQEEQSAESVTTEPSDDVLNYDICLDSAMGPLFYYNQDDALWSDYLWGGTDDLSTYGCGPTTMAMIVNSFVSESNQVTPITIADYCLDHYLFCKGHGSYHEIVEDVLTHYGFIVTSLQNDLTVESVENALHRGHLVVALVGPGYFSDYGHYLIITADNGDGTMNVADSKSLDNTLRPFRAQFLIDELHYARDGGAPLWEVSLGDTN